MMMDYKLEKFQNWCSDYCISDSFLAQSSVIREYAPEFLTQFLIEALGDNEENHSQFELGDVSRAFQSTGSKLNLPASVSDACPEMCAGFLEYLENTGRVGGGNSIAPLIREMKISSEVKTLKRPGSKLNRNDPCPCGSKRKYKKCCMNLLG
jgi:hypothetical protein